MNTEGIIAWGWEVVVKYGVSSPTTEEALVVKYSVAPPTPLTVVKYGVYPVFKSLFVCSLQVRRTESLISKLTIHPYNRMEGDVEVYGYGQSTFKGRLYVRIHETLNAVLKVSPWNKMSGIADIQPIPRVDRTLYPIKDAFIRSGVIRMNYGKEQSMTFGTIDNSPYTENRHEIFQVLLQFDLAHLPNNVEVEKAILRLHSIYELKDSIFEIVNNLNEWAETTVAWVNKPSIGENLVQFNTEKDSYVVEVDVLPIVKKWAEEKEENCGFTIKLLDELLVLTQSFYTREYGDSRYRPQLELRYYNKDLIVSIGRTPLSGSLIVSRTENKDLRSKITIKSRLGDAAFRGNMIVVNPKMRNGLITISRPSMVGTVGVRRIDDKTGVYGSIIVPNHTFNEGEFKLSVNRKFIHSSVTVKERKDIDTTIIIANTRFSDLIPSIIVSKPNLVGRVVVNYRDDLNSILTVRYSKTINNEATITISRTGLVGKIDVMAQRSLLSKIVTTRGKEGYLNGRLKLKENITLSGKIEVVKSSSLTSRLMISSGNFYGNLVVYGRGENELLSSLNIKKSSLSYMVAKLKIKENRDISTKLIVKNRNEFKGKIDYIPTSRLTGKISVISGNFYGSLAIPAYDYKEFNNSMIVNVRMISEVLGVLTTENPRLFKATITVRKKVESYAFIM